MSELEKEPTGKVKTPPDVIDAMRNIARIEDENSARISETMFKARILPIFVTPGGNLDTWVEITGSLQRSIDVIDENGQLLFTAPAPLRTVPTTISGGRSDSFMEIIARAETMMLRNPIQAQGYLAQMIQDRSKRYDVSEIDERKQWLVIMARYGYTPEGVDLPTDFAKTTSEEQNRPIFSGQDEPL